MLSAGAVAGLFSADRFAPDGLWMDGSLRFRWGAVPIFPENRENFLLFLGKILLSFFCSFLYFYFILLFYIAFYMVIYCIFALIF